MKRITVLGSTGSIGTNTLDVLGRHTDRFTVFALTAAKQVDLLFKQCVAFKPQWAVMTDLAAAQELKDRLQAAGLTTQVASGASALVDVSQDEAVDVVMGAIVGAAGLPPCLAAAAAGKQLLLANKEALVVGGDLFMATVQEGGGALLPIDSEHSAIFQSLPDDRSSWARRVDKIILTASGGPFRTRDPATFQDITPEQAVAHPNWVMGQKISVDSATMMNKALEVIEAHYLFGLPPERLEVVIHPQSIVHSMVQYHDTSIVAQLGTADMRVPIAYGLSYPERVTSGATPLNFETLSQLTFERPDPARFPGLQLAWAALKGRPGSTAVLNAANEIAVDAFLTGRIRFDQIHVVNAETLGANWSGQTDTLEALLALDVDARQLAGAVVARLS